MGMCEVKKIGLSLQPDCLGGGIGRHAGLKLANRKLPLLSASRETLRVELP